MEQFHNDWTERLSALEKENRMLLQQQRDYAFRCGGAELVLKALVAWADDDHSLMRNIVPIIDQARLTLAERGKV
jgi:hypothetical protein